jgi:glycine/serine hydroxymethyltransferase
LCAAFAVLSACIREGVDIVRLNFSHGTHEEHGRNIALVRHCRHCVARMRKGARACPRVHARRLLSV